MFPSKKGLIAAAMLSAAVMSYHSMSPDADKPRTFALLYVSLVLSLWLALQYLKEYLKDNKD